MVSLSRQLALASVTGLALLCLCVPSWATDGAIRNIRYDESDRHFIIDASGPVKAMVNTLNIAGRKRIIIDLDNAEIGVELPRDAQLLQDLSRQLPDLRNVTVNQYGGNGRPIVRILLDLQGDPGTVRLVHNQGLQIELELNPSALATAPNYSSPNPVNRSLTMPPSLSSLPRENSEAQSTSSNTISQEQYNRSLQAQQDQKRQIDALQRQIGSLNQQLANANSHNSDVDDQKRTLDDLNQKYARLLQDNQDLKARLDNANQDQSTSQSEQAKLRTELERLRADNQALQTRVSQASSAPRAVASTGPALDELKRTLAEMNRRYDQLAQENQSLKSQLDAKPPTPTDNGGVSDADLQKLHSQLTLAQQSLNDSIRTINEQNKEIAYLRNQVSDVKAGLDASSKEQLARLQASLDDKNSTIQDLQRQLAAKGVVSSGTGSSQGEANSLKRQLATMTDQYQSDLRSLNQQLKDKSEQVQTLEAQANRADELQQENTRLQSQLDDANRTIADGKTSRVPATELQKRDNRIAALQSERDAVKRELAAMQAELNTLKNSKESAGKASTSLKEAMDRLTRENQDLQSKVDSMNQQQASDNNEQLRQLQNQVASLTQKYNQASQDASKAKQDLMAYQRSHNNSATGTTTGKSDPGLQKQVADLNRQLADARKENASLRDSLSSKASRPTTVANPEAEQDYQEGKAALAAKDIAKALDKLKEAQLLDPDNANYITDYSSALAEDHQYADAIDMLRRYLQRNPADREAYNQLGKIYLLNDEADAANQAFTRALSISTLNNYATSLKKLGRMDDAEQVFKLALTMNPKDSEVLFNLGNLYNAENKLELARNKYLEALQIKPDFAEAHYNLGLIFSKLGDNAKAVTHLEKFLELSPNARNADTIRTYVQKLKA